jgi:hypothetical protein
LDRFKLDKTAQGEGMAEGSRKALRRFIVLTLFLHNINNNNVIIIVFNSFDIHILLWLTQ